MNDARFLLRLRQRLFQFGNARSSIRRGPFRNVQFGQLPCSFCFRFDLRRYFFRRYNFFALFLQGIDLFFGRGQTFLDFTQRRFVRSAPRPDKRIRPTRPEVRVLMLKLAEFSMQCLPPRIKFINAALSRSHRTEIRQRRMRRALEVLAFVRLDNFRFELHSVFRQYLVRG